MANLANSVVFEPVHAAVLTAAAPIAEGTKTRRVHDPFSFWKTVRKPIPRQKHQRVAGRDLSKAEKVAAKAAEAKKTYHEAQKLEKARLVSNIKLLLQSGNWKYKKGESWAKARAPSVQWLDAF